MDLHKMDEFRSNLLLLLQCGHPEGLAINRLKSEYKQYFLEDVGPETILPRGYKNSKHWDALFTLKEFKEDFTLFYLGTVVYVKAVRKRSHSEMKLIAQLAKHSHLQTAKKSEFQCGCCTPEFWKSIAKDAAIEPASTSNSQELTQGQPEDIVVKIEPDQMMNNGDDDENSTGDGMGGGGSSGHEALFSLDPHGNHQRSSFVNGSAVANSDPSGSSTSNLNCTNDGFMLDHQLRIQQHVNSQSLQAFASLLNSSGAAGGQSSNSEAGGSGQVVPQPFFTFLLQNGELKVMQVVSTAPENGDNNTSTSGSSANQSTGIAGIPQMNLSDLINPPPPVNLGFVCSMVGCGQKFDEKQLLQNHERTCSVKKYPCTFPACDRRFKNSKQRHAHMTSRHRGTENAFHCTVPACAAFFKTADRLKVHESRCRFKYEQFQLMDVEEMALLAMNNNNNSSNFTMPPHSSVPNLTTSSSAESVEPRQPGPTPAFNALQTAAIVPAMNRNSVPVAHIPGVRQRSKVETNEPDPTRGTPDLQGFSTIDLSLVKSEVMD